MAQGLERAPVYPSGFEETATGRYRESLLAFAVLLTHDVWLESYLDVNGDSPFIATTQDLLARQAFLVESKASSHVTTRGIHQLGILAQGTVRQMEEEFGHKTTLDIGCGTGRLGTELVRKAKSEVTFLDNDADVLTTIPQRLGQIVAADGTALPFRDESFARTVSCFSSLAWEDTPVRTVQSLNEALRVTESGGSVIAVPLMSNISGRISLARDQSFDKLHGKPPRGEDEGGLKVWASQDHALLQALLYLAEKGYCSITWGGYLATGQNTGAKLETYTAIIDKVRPIPIEVLDHNLLFASQFMDKPNLEQFSTSSSEPTAVEVK